jgi:hypothetical protein
VSESVGILLMRVYAKLKNMVMPDVIGMCMRSPTLINKLQLPQEKLFEI